MTIERLLGIISNENMIFPEIKEEDALQAYMGALIQIKDKYDALYFFACMNLLNAYVKKSDAGREFARRYIFKTYAARGMEQVIRKEIDGVEIYLDTHVAYVSVVGLQFSFHNVRTTYTLNSYINSKRNKKQEWRGIRLQPPAGLIFKWAEEVRNSKGRSLGETAV